MTEQHKLTPTERLHDLAMAAITKTSAGVARRTPEIGMYGVGANQGRWHCKSLGGNPVDEGLTPLQGWAVELELATQVQRDLAKLNAASLADDLAASAKAVK
jgi:hypothetical protein